MRWWVEPASGCVRCSSATNLPTLSVGWYTIVSSDLVHRLSEARHLSLFNGYKLLLLGVCAEGRITAKQRSAVDEYRRPQLHLGRRPRVHAAGYRLDEGRVGSAAASASHGWKASRSTSAHAERRCERSAQQRLRRSYTSFPSLTPPTGTCSCY